MTPIIGETIEEAIAIIGATGTTKEAIESRVFELVSDTMTARRMIDWIPEAFGLVLVAHISNKIILPTTFSAKAANGSWKTLRFDVEPVFLIAMQIAQRIYHEGPRELFQNIALQSCMTDTVNNALKAGGNLDGAVLSGPALIGIPAEVYHSPPRLFG